MKSLISAWIGKNVHVTLRATVPVTVEGLLLNADESGVLLELPKGHTYVPLTSILHVSVNEG